MGSSSQSQDKCIVWVHFSGISFLSQHLTFLCLIYVSYGADWIMDEWDIVRKFIREWTRRTILTTFDWSSTGILLTSVSPTFTRELTIHQSQSDMVFSSLSSEEHNELIIHDPSLTNSSFTTATEGIFSDIYSCWIRLVPTVYWVLSL